MGGKGGAKMPGSITNDGGVVIVGDNASLTNTGVGETVTIGEANVVTTETITINPDPAQVMAAAGDFIGLLYAQGVDAPQRQALVEAAEAITEETKKPEPDGNGILRRLKGMADFVKEAGSTMKGAVTVLDGIKTFAAVLGIGLPLLGLV